MEALAVLVFAGIAGLIGYSMGKSNVDTVRANAEREKQKLVSEIAAERAELAKVKERQEREIAARETQLDQRRLSEQRKIGVEQMRAQQDLADEHKRLRREIETQRLQFDFETKRQTKYLDERDEAFRTGFVNGRKWLADMIAETESVADMKLERQLLGKERSAPKAAEAVKRIGAQKREINLKLKFLEYQLRSYEEYFPFLEDYREAILDERIPLLPGSDNREQLQESDPVIRFLDKEEYDKLCPAERHQLALDRYLKRPKTNWEVGLLYERYVGYLYELKGWKVTYRGAIKGFADFGRDLVCYQDDKVKIVQAKYWRQEKVVREKHVFQLFGTACLVKRQHPDRRVEAVFYSTTQLSEEALDVAKQLKVNVRVRPFDHDYPCIKCNINPKTKDKIYHLPFDQQYDHAAIGNYPGECYAKTCQEAEELGFRRAWKYSGPTKSPGTSV